MPDGPIFAYEGAQLPTQPFMWMEVYHQPPTDAQLAPFKMTRSDWDKDHAEQVKRDQQELEQCGGGSYHVTINLPGIEHFSFTDQPFITAKTKQDADRAGQALHVVSDYTDAFFESYLNDKKNTLLTKPAESGTSVEKFGTAR